MPRIWTLTVANPDIRASTDPTAVARVGKQVRVAAVGARGVEGAADRIVGIGSVGPAAS